MNRQQANRVAPFLFRDRLELARTNRLLVAHEADEAFDVGAAQLLVRAREPRELAEVRIAAAAVPLREHGEVVVVLRNHPFAEALEREARRGGRQPVVALPEGAQQLDVALRQRCGQLALERDEERPFRRGAPQQDERVVRDAHER